MLAHTTACSYKNKVCCSSGRIFKHFKSERIVCNGKIESANCQPILVSFPCLQSSIAVADYSLKEVTGLRPRCLSGFNSPRAVPPIGSTPKQTYYTLIGWRALYRMHSHMIMLVLVSKPGYTRETCGKL